MLAVLKDAMARTVRIAEAFQDEDRDFVRGALDDLAADLWALIEAEETSREGEPVPDRSFAPGARR